MFCDRRPLEPLVFSIISVAVHPLGHMITGFTNILLSTLGACNKVDNIGCLTTGVAPEAAVFNTSPRDLANINALKNHVRSLLLHKN